MIIEKSLTENKLILIATPFSLIRIRYTESSKSIAERLVAIDEQLKHKTNVSLDTILDISKSLEPINQVSKEETHDLVLDLEQYDDSENIIVSLVDLFGSGYVSMIILNELNILVPVTLYDEYDRAEIENTSVWMTYPLSILADSRN